MVTCDGLRQLADLVDRVEREGVSVESATVSSSEGADLAVDLSVRLTADGHRGRPDGATDGATAGGVDRGDGDSRSNRAGNDDVEPGQLRTGDGSAITARDGGFGRPAPSAEFGNFAVSVGGSVSPSWVDGSPWSAGPATKTATDAADPDAGTGDSSDDEPVVCRVDGCEERFETEHGMKIHATKAHQAADGSAPSPHRDPDRLREVYESCDTFDEMTAELGVDVTPQTVRRSAMALGVHDPESPRLGVSSDGEDGSGEDDEAGSQSDDEAGSQGDHATGSQRDGEAGAPGEDDMATPDGADVATAGGDDGGANEPTDLEREVEGVLPDDVDGPTLVAAVRDASTLYELQRAMDMEREEVQTLLAELDLLDLVHGRVATKQERDEEKVEIERRIVEAVEAVEAE